MALIVWKVDEKSKHSHSVLTIVLADGHGADGDYEAAVVAAFLVLAGHIAVSVDS